MKSLFEILKHLEYQIKGKIKFVSPAVKRESILIEGEDKKCCLLFTVFFLVLVCPGNQNNCLHNASSLKRPYSHF